MDFIKSEGFEALAPYPNSLIKISSFLSQYFGKQFLDNPISSDQKEIFKNLTGKNLFSSRELLTFYFRVMKLLDHCDESFSIVKVRAFWLNFDDDNSNNSSPSLELEFKNALYIQDFPGFELEHLDLDERIPSLWYLSTLKGYCKGHECDLFLKKFQVSFTLEI